MSNKALVAFAAHGTPEGNVAIVVSVKPLQERSTTAADTGLRMSNAAAYKWTDDHCDTARIVTMDQVDSAVANLLAIAQS